VAAAGAAAGAGTKDNDIINNIVACPAGRVQRGMISLEPDRWRDHAGSRIQRNILYTVGPDQNFMWRDVIAQGNPPAICRIEADRNIYFNASDPKAGDDYLAWARRHGREVNSIRADPLFENAAAGNFRLKPDSPALKLGIQPIMLQAGIRR